MARETVFHINGRLTKDSELKRSPGQYAGGGAPWC